MPMCSALSWSHVMICTAHVIISTAQEIQHLLGDANGFRGSARKNPSGGLAKRVPSSVATHGRN